MTYTDRTTTPPAPSEPRLQATPPRNTDGLTGDDLMRSVLAHQIDVEDLTTEQIAPLLKKGDARGLRLTQIFSATASVMKDDVKDHPWKLFFYILPIPPFGAAVVATGTVLHIALGLTKRAREHRHKAVNAFRQAIDYKAYGKFMEARAATEKAPSPHIAVNWHLLRQNLLYQGKIVLLNMGLEWSASLPDNPLTRAFNRSLERQIISNQTSYLVRETKVRGFGKMGL